MNMILWRRMALKQTLFIASLTYLRSLRVCYADIVGWWIYLPHAAIRSGDFLPSKSSRSLPWPLLVTILMTLPAHARPTSHAGPPRASHSQATRGECNCEEVQVSTSGIFLLFCRSPRCNIAPRLSCSQPVAQIANSICFLRPS